MFADDFSPHETENVWRMCWSRGYVVIPHGGGATPVAQTPDTDLNQHVRRECTTEETRDLIWQFRNTAVAAPKVKHEKSIDITYTALSSTQLHLRAAAGYKTLELT